MGFNKRKMEDRRRQAAEKEAAARRATDRQILEDADHLITVWNERQAKRMPMLFSPTIGAAITAGYWFLWVRCPACRTTGDVDLRSLDWHHGAAVTALTPALSCRCCRPNAPFAELVQILGDAFDAACKKLHDKGQPSIVYEVIARRIIDAAKKGVRNPVLLRDIGLAALPPDKIAG